MIRFLRNKALGSPLAVLVLVAIILGGALVLSRAFFEQRAPDFPGDLPSVPPVGMDRDSNLFWVSRLQGDVEAFQDGQWYVLRAGHLLSSKDVVRTKSGARATLRRGSIELELRDNMDLGLDDLEKETARVGILRGGRISASVGDAKETLEITAKHTRTRNLGIARFVVSMTDGGKVSVAASEGSAQFEGKEKSVVVGPGSTSTAMPDQAPSDPEPIPTDLLLSVIWPEDDRVTDKATLKGKAQPSTRIYVNSSETEVAADGTFAVKLPLTVGKNRVEVKAEDIAGRKKVLEKSVTRIVPSPTLEVTEDELWNP